MTFAGITAMNRIDIAGHLERIFRENGEHTFIRCASTGRSLTYSEFQSIARKIAKHLWATYARDGLGAEQISVMVMYPNSIEVLLLYWAVLLLNGRVIPVDPLKGMSDRQVIVSKVRPDVLVAEDAFCHEGASFSMSELMSRACENDAADIDGLIPIDFERDYLIIFTSGSTGEAKGIVHSFSNLFLSAMSFGREFAFSRNSVFLHNFPMAFMAGILNSFVMPLVFGVTIVLGERQSVSAVFSLWRHVRENSVNTFWLSPTFLNMLLQLDRGDEGVEYCKRNKVVICTGTAPLDADTKRRFEDRYGVEIYESYGLSETLFVTSNVPGLKQITGSVGIPLEGVSVTAAEDGELLVDVPWLMKGYWQSVRCPNSPFPTGDIGKNDAGRVFVTGRKKDLIIKGGINISPRVIEDFIRKKVRLSGMMAVVGMSDPLMGECVVCFYQDRGFSVDRQKEVNRLLLADIGKDFVVDKYAYISEFPLNINGKIDKLLLRRLAI